jgi:DNA modification methylase
MAVMNQVVESKYALYNGDCIEVMAKMPDEKIHASIYSPPFGGLYNYSSSINDLSNSTDYDDFFVHYEFVVKEIHRITMNGRFSAVHCTDIPSGNSGKGDYLTDFAGDIIRLHEKNGFKFVARHTIWKEPLWVRNRTMVKGLAHKTIVDDATNATVASADYLLIFRKKL